jgi:hypothetical protein
MEELLFEHRKGDGESIRFTKNEYKGETYYHIRTYVRSQDFSSKEEIWIPTKKGVAFTKLEMPWLFQGIVKFKEDLDVPE